jgi:hypothetical protein
MNSRFTITYLRQSEIDRRKWDACISSSGHGIIYALSSYLDQMSRHWDALVLNDYEAVMPLTWNRKYGIYYLYQPFLTPQLGLFGKNISVSMLKAFMEAIPKKFKFIEINLNTGNDFVIADVPVRRHPDYWLDLSTTYKTISSHYNENLRRNLKKAALLNCEYREHINVADVVELARPQLQRYTKLLKNDISHFKKLVESLVKPGTATTAGVFINNELISGCVLLNSLKKVHYILAANHAKSKVAGASHFLIDQFFRKHAGEDLLFDFVGSDFPTIAQFYKSFGATPQFYPSVRLNRLPGVVKWIKK